MTPDGRRISVSVATLEFLPVAGGTRLIVTEQGVTSTAWTQWKPAAKYALPTALF